MELFLAKVKKVNPNGTLEVESFESPERAIDVQILTSGWQFWKPFVNDVVLIAKTPQNVQICLGTLHPGHEEWIDLFPDAEHTNIKIVNEGHWISDNQITAGGSTLP